MDKFIIQGGTRLKGKIRINGAKNSALPIMAATLLGAGESELSDVPSIRDVRTMCEMLRRFGAQLDTTGGTITIRADNVMHTEAPYEIIKTMRASFVVMGPLLAKLGRTRVALPGGCAIGTRPVDIHLKGFQKLGAKIDIVHGYVEARCRKLRGNRVYLDFPSVGATENLIMAAAMAEGETVLENAAREPEVSDLADFLRKMGAGIEGDGTDVIHIQGGRLLTGTRHRIIPDRIEGGTFMIAAAVTGGDVLIENIRQDHIEAVCAKLTEAGITLKWDGDTVRVKGGRTPAPVNIKTLPYPGFPTDLQAQFMVLLTVASGASVVTETIFENRFMHVLELVRMGADASIEERSAVIRGVKGLGGAPVMASDLRAGAALVMAGLIARGTTEVARVYHIDRGYEGLEHKLNALGADIRRVKM